MRLLITGPMKVGKLSFMKRLSRGVFDESFATTIGVGFVIKRVWYQGMPMCVQIWDTTSGSRPFRTITAAQLKNAAGVFFCFDLSDAESFEYLQRYIDLATRFIAELNSPNNYNNWFLGTLGSMFDGAKKIMSSTFASSPALNSASEYGPSPKQRRTHELMLVGLKSDLARSVTQEAALRLAARYRMTYMECSSKTNENVELVLGTMLNRVIGSQFAHRDALLRHHQQQQQQQPTALLIPGLALLIFTRSHNKHPSTFFFFTIDRPTHTTMVGCSVSDFVAQSQNTRN